MRPRSRELVAHRLTSQATWSHVPDTISMLVLLYFHRCIALALVGMDLIL